MAESHIPGQIHKLFWVFEDLRTKPVSFAGVNPSPRATGGNPTSILPPVLENRKTIVDIGNSGPIRVCEDNREDSTHFVYLPRGSVSLV